MYRNIDNESGYSEGTPILRPESRNRVIPLRYVLAIVSCLGFFNVYAMRVNLSVAMVAMVGKTGEEHMAHGIVACKELLSSPQILNSYATIPNTTQTIIQNQQEVFDWNSRTQSNILGAFFIGYVITQIPGGIIAEKYGAKLIFGVGVLITSIFTLLTPVAASWGVEYLIAVRFIEGLGEGVTYPAMNALIGRWVPKNERSRIATIIFNGSPIGTVVSLAVSGYLSDSPNLGGWPMVFYLFGVLGCLWFVFWMLLVHESPEEHPRITKAELQYIKAGQDSKKGCTGRIPWRAILTSKPLWALAVTHFGFNWGFYTLLTELPTYLSNVLHFDLKHNGLLSATPYLCQALFSSMASIIADRMRETNNYRITTIRKIMNSIAFFIPAVLVATVSLVGCNSPVILTLIILSVAFSGFMYSGFNVTHVDMSPEFAGTLMGITNCIANMSGFLAPSYVGLIVQDGQSVENWNIVFITTSAVYVVTGLVYNIFASAELQPWGLSSNQTKTEISPTGAVVELPEEKKILPSRTDNGNEIP